MDGGPPPTAAPTPATDPAAASSSENANPSIPVATDGGIKAASERSRRAKAEKEVLVAQLAKDTRQRVKREVATKACADAAQETMDAQTKKNNKLGPKKDAASAA